MRTTGSQALLATEERSRHSGQRKVCASSFGPRGIFRTTLVQLTCDAHNRSRASHRENTCQSAVPKEPALPTYATASALRMRALFFPAIYCESDLLQAK